MLRPVALRYREVFDTGGEWKAASERLVALTGEGRDSEAGGRYTYVICAQQQLSDYWSVESRLTFGRVAMKASSHFAHVTCAQQVVCLGSQNQRTLGGPW